MTAAVINARLEVEAALAEDAACRHVGVTAGLYGIQDLAPFRRYECTTECPVVVSVQHTPTTRLMYHHRAASDAEFAARLHTAVPLLEALDLKALGLVVAGGAASALLMGPGHYADTAAIDSKSVGSKRAAQQHNGMVIPMTYHDIDLFLVGHDSDEAALAAISALGDALLECWGHPMTVYRTSGCVTFFSAGVAAPQCGVVQVILRRYSTVAEIIHGFDMGSSAVAWDGEHVYLTRLGRIAAERGANVLNIVARRSSYEHRITKYFARGYDLVLPNLDADGLRHPLPEDCCRLPYLAIYGTPLPEANGFRPAWHLAATRPGLNDYGRRDPAKSDKWVRPSPVTSDYGHEIQYGVPAAVMVTNVKAIRRQAMPAMCASAPYTAGLDIRSISVVIDQALFQSLIENAIGMGVAVYQEGRGLMHSAIINWEQCVEIHKALAVFEQGGPNTIARAIAATSAAAFSELDALPRDIPFQLMRVEENTALTGPFPRAVISLEAWYGDYFKAN